MNRYWPQIENSERAIAVMRNGAWAAAFVSFVTIAVSLSATYVHHPVMGMDGWGILDGVLFAIVFWRMYRLSLPWAIAGLVMFIAEKVLTVASNPASIGSGVILGLILLFYFINAVRAGLYLRRTNALWNP